MIETLYLFYSGIAFLMLFFGVVNPIKLDRQARILLVLITFLLFVYLSLNSFNIERTHCGYTLNSTNDVVQRCNTLQITDGSVGVLNLLFAILSLLYIILDYFNFIPHANKQADQIF